LKVPSPRCGHFLDVSRGSLLSRWILEEQSDPLLPPSYGLPCPLLPGQAVVEICSPPIYRFWKDRLRVHRLFKSELLPTGPSLNDLLCDSAIVILWSSRYRDFPVDNVLLGFYHRLGTWPYSLPLSTCLSVRFTTKNGSFFCALPFFLLFTRETLRYLRVAISLTSVLDLIFPLVRPFSEPSLISLGPNLSVVLSRFSNFFLRPPLVPYDRRSRLPVPFVHPLSQEFVGVPVGSRNCTSFRSSRLRFPPRNPPARRHLFFGNVSRPLIVFCYSQYLYVFWP